MHGSLHAVYQLVCCSALVVQEAEGFAEGALKGSVASAQAWASFRKSCILVVCTKMPKEAFWDLFTQVLDETIKLLQILLSPSPSGWAFSALQRNPHSPIHTQQSQAYDTSLTCRLDEPGRCYRWTTWSMTSWATDVSIIVRDRMCVFWDETMRNDQSARRYSSWLLLSGWKSPLLRFLLQNLSATSTLKKHLVSQVIYCSLMVKD